MKSVGGKTKARVNTRPGLGAQAIKPSITAQARGYNNRYRKATLMDTAHHAERVPVAKGARGTELRLHAHADSSIGARDGLDRHGRRLHEGSRSEGESEHLHSKDSKGANSAGLVVEAMQGLTELLCSREDSRDR